jgi:predicted Zn-dependent protease
MADDYLNGYVDITGIQTIFGPVDEKRESVLAKKRALEEIVNRYPRFRAGHLHLAVAWLQLHRAGEALTALQDYYALNSEDPEVNYYLSILHAQRLDYNQAWFFLHQAETITAARDHKPKVLKELRRALLQCCPE